MVTIKCSHERNLFMWRSHLMWRRENINLLSFQWNWLFELILLYICEIMEVEKPQRYLRIESSRCWIANAFCIRKWTLARKTTCEHYMRNVKYRKFLKLQLLYIFDKRKKMFLSKYWPDCSNGFDKNHG